MRVAVFVDGCFWHGCPRHRSLPASNVIFWLQKLRRNRDRDKLVSATLRSKGWTVVRIWQHELTRANRQKLVTRLRNVLGMR
jgi:DNA mismatch endonuclease (patch repair protein)